MGDEPIQIEVGAVGPAFGHYSDPPVFEGDQFVDQPSDLPWEDRKKVTITTTLSTPLGEVIDQAAERLGVGIQPGPISKRVPCISFYRGEQYSFISVVDRDGQRGWPVGWSDIQIGELIASGEAGLVKGDPHRPMLWPVIPQAVFTDIAGALLYMWMLWEHYLAARETTNIARTVVQRLRRGRAVGGANPAQRNVAWHDAFRRVNDLMASSSSPSARRRSSGR
jgi:hypothetical protein